MEEIVKKLDKLYLLEIKYSKDGEQFCSLHFFYYDHLLNHCVTDPEEKRAMHSKLVNNYR